MNKKRCKHHRTFEKERYQVICIRNAEKEGYCLEHYHLHKREDIKPPDSIAILESPVNNYNPLISDEALNHNRVRSEKREFIRRFGKPIDREVVK